MRLHRPPVVACLLALPCAIAHAGPEPAAPVEGPFVHRVLSAWSEDGLAFTRDEGVRWEHASVPCAVADGDRVLLYAVDADRGPRTFESTELRTSSDGLRFERQSLVIEGMTTQKALDPCVVRESAGRFRLYYLGSDAPGDPASRSGDHRIHVALSEDGVRFREAGVALSRPALVDPDVFRFRGTWFCWAFGRGHTEIATSKDGLEFEYQRDLDLDGYGTVAPIALDDARLRLYAFEQGKPSGNAIVSFVSTDGVSWTREAGLRLVAGADEQITDPYVVRWKGGWRMYYKSEPRRARPPDGRAHPGIDRPGPWDHDVKVLRALGDGPAESLATFPRAGVPTVARLADGRLLAAHQHFPPHDDAAFDKVAVRTSSDEGRTWSAAQVIALEGLPAGLRFPFDPTLVPLPDGRVRLYFTSAPLRGGPSGASLPSIHSAISKDGFAYVVEPGVRFAVEGRSVIDCAVVLHKGVFHLFAPDNGTGHPPAPGAPMPPEAERPRAGVGYHATSADGLAFTRQADVRIEGRGRWLGNAQSDGASIVFLGTAEPGLWMSTSPDGVTWTAPTSWSRIEGADPGLVRLRDGSWLVVVTGPPRDVRRAPGPGGR